VACRNTDYRSEFRRVPLGDIDLQREIRLDRDSGVVSAQTRRYHSAKIDRGTSSVTVVMYQGEKAKEVRRGIPCIDMEVS
jgi:hypothetical protein